MGVGLSIRHKYRGGVVKYTGQQVTQRIDAAMERRLHHIGQMVASRVREKIGVSAERKPGTKTVFLNPSREGEPPHARTGTLRKSYTYDVEVHLENWGKVVRIGSPVEYSKFLEDEKDLNRPHLRASVKELEPKIREILTAPIN